MADRIAVFDSHYDCGAFDCGSAPLNDYLHRQISQDIRRRVTTGFLAIAGEGRTAGFYTLAAAIIPLADLPQQDRCGGG